MITVITGTPGAGKSAYVVAELMGVESRPVFVDGIPELLLPHLPPGEVKEWHDWVPDGALVVIDECQRHFGLRRAGSEVPPWISGFETHRHRGLDFWLITQDATMLDAHVRKLVGRHIHLEANWLGRKLFEWNRVSDPTSRTDRQLAASRSYKLPKKAFSLYKSAEIHTKQPRRIPKAAFAVLLALILLPTLGWRVYSSVSDKLSPSGAGLVGKAGPVPAQPAGAGIAVSDSPGARIANWVPRIQDRPESAPVYDKVTEIKSAPVIVGCIANASRCTCYTDQATRVYLDQGQCRDLLDAPRHNPYKDPIPRGGGDMASNAAGSSGRGVTSPQEVSSAPSGGTSVIAGSGGPWGGIPATSSWGGVR